MIYFVHDNNYNLTIITSIINDNETWVKGIPSVNEELLNIGFTQKEVGLIVWGLTDIINRLCKKL